MTPSVAPAATARSVFSPQPSVGSRLRLAVVRLALVLAALASAHRASAAPPAAPAAEPDAATREARSWVKVATEQYARANWQGALEAYLKAWSVKQHFAIAANLADVEYRLGKYRDAAAHLQFYIAHLPPEYADQRRAAEERLAQCRSHLIPVQVTVNVLGASVLLDGVELGRAPLTEDLWLEPGAHSLEAQRPGYVGARREFTASLGESRNVSLVLKRAAPEVRGQPGSPARVAPVRGASSAGVSPRTWVLVGGGALTAVAVGTGVVYAITASNADGRLRDRRSEVELLGNPALAATHSVCSTSTSQNPSGCSALPGLRDERNDARVVSGVALISAGVVGSLTLASYFFWLREAGRPENTGKPATGRLPSLRVSAAPSFGGVEWSGAF